MGIRAGFQAALAETKRAGAKRTGLGGQSFDYGRGQYLIVSVDLPLDAHLGEATGEAPFLGLGYTLRPEAIASLLLETGGASPHEPTRRCRRQRDRLPADPAAVGCGAGLPQKPCGSVPAP
ncbi:MULTISPECIES: AraC family transcriptional regulator [unclassified Bosea]|uniref:AraC family transcriptional regulator n=1 Tax=Bosea sp. Tri-49 TaxID=1867715 RepID=UPI0019D1E48A